MHGLGWWTEQLFIHVAELPSRNDPSGDCYRDELLNIIQEGADINATDEEGMTPLHIAVQEGNVLAVEILLDLDADVNALNNDYQTPFDIAVERRDQVIIDLLPRSEIEGFV